MAGTKSLWLLLATAVWAASATFAAADGMPRAPDPYAYRPAPVFLEYNWTGIYVGAHAGVGTAGWDWSNDSLLLQEKDQRRTAFVGGTHIGIQKQWNRIVVGAEISYSWADLGSTGGSTVVAGTTHSSTMNDLLMVTGRLGAVDQNMLAYFKGGFASADIGLQSNGPGGALITSSRDREYGWVGGLGFEYGWRPDIIVGVEYDFVHFSAGNNQLSGGVDIQTLMARVNYKFGPH